MSGNSNEPGASILTDFPDPVDPQLRPFCGVALAWKTLVEVGEIVSSACPTMTARNDGAGFHYDGIDGMWRSAALWSLVCVVCCWFSLPPAWILGVAAVVGMGAGAVNALWLYRLKPSRIEPTRWAALAVVLAMCLWVGIRASTLGYLAIGSLLTATINLAMAVLFPKVVAKLNRTFFPKSSPARPTAPRDEESARLAFLNELPEPLRAEMAGTFVSATAILPAPAGRDLDPFASSFGGSPLFAPGQSWPERDGRRLNFLAQINLGDVSAHLPEGMPEGGLLSFFYDPEQPWGSEREDAGAGRILFARDPAGCAPSNEIDGQNASQRQALGFRKVVVQNTESWELEERFYKHYRSLKGKPKDRLSALHDRILEFNCHENRLFSKPGLVQCAMDQELETAASAYGLDLATPWTMVLQLASVDEQDWCWGDAGCIYFWVPTADLSALRFDRVWVVLQCT